MRLASVRNLWFSPPRPRSGTFDLPRVIRLRSLTPAGSAGGLLAEVGIAVASANWVSVAVFAAAWLAIIAWRIHIEETALLSALGGKYRSYASHHKRLIPLVW
jgi:hypothetical protein